MVLFLTQLGIERAGESAVKFCTEAVVTAVSLLLLSATAHAIPFVTIDVDPGTPGIQSRRNVASGDSFSVDVLVTGVDARHPVFAFAFRLRNDSIIEATGATKGHFLPIGGPTDFAASADPDGVFVVDTLLGPASGVSGSGILASVTYNAVGRGTTPVRFEFVELAGFLPGVPDPEPIPVRFASVPVPSTMLLLGLGLACLAGVRRTARP